MWATVLVVALLVALAVAIAWYARAKQTTQSVSPTVQQPTAQQPTLNAGCRHTVCCDSLCPSLSQYYDASTGQCLERPKMPYGYGRAHGPCLVDLQLCDVNPGPAPCQQLCDRFGNTLVYTGFSGASALRRPFLGADVDSHV